VVTRKHRGRPPRADEASTKRIEFRTTPAEYDQIRRLAARNGATIGEWCRFAALAAAGDSGEPLAVVIGGSLGEFAIVERD
jgi:hypothetical protein